jgi:hypothetical protein
MHVAGLGCCRTTQLPCHPSRLSVQCCNDCFTANTLNTHMATCVEAEFKLLMTPTTQRVDFVALSDWKHTVPCLGHSFGTPVPLECSAFLPSCVLKGTWAPLDHHTVLPPGLLIVPAVQHY